ncbi:hypothetical protein BB558_004094 [Smittium angustum]|uniref:RING-type domain-containing protein n=1 Tax=Smittium angustum TaxID=133377 RepID=A0A2U1J460_SMIAN|nr:hypothetical protein BB558_004094 [Smittium angustum]
MTDSKLLNKSSSFSSQESIFKDSSTSIGLLRSKSHQTLLLELQNPPQATKSILQDTQKHGNTTQSLKYTLYHGSINDSDTTKSEKVKDFKKINFQSQTVEQSGNKPEQSLSKKESIQFQPTIRESEESSRKPILKSAEVDLNLSPQITVYDEINETHINLNLETKKESQVISTSTVSRFFSNKKASILENVEDSTTPTKRKHQVDIKAKKTDINILDDFVSSPESKNIKRNSKVGNRSVQNQSYHMGVNLESLSTNINKNNQNDPSNSTDFIETSKGTTTETVDAGGTVQNNIDSDEPICPICFDLFSTLNSKRAVSLKCGHAFCKSCIYNWFGIKGNVNKMIYRTKMKINDKSCPKCNKKSSYKDFRIIYPSCLVAADEEKFRDATKKIEELQNTCASNKTLINNMDSELRGKRMEIAILRQSLESINKKYIKALSEIESLKTKLETKDKQQDFESRHVDISDSKVIEESMNLEYINYLDNFGRNTNNTSQEFKTETDESFEASFSSEKTNFVVDIRKEKILDQLRIEETNCLELVDTNMNLPILQVKYPQEQIYILACSTTKTEPGSLSFLLCQSKDLNCEIELNQNSFFVLSRSELLKHQRPLKAIGISPNILYNDPKTNNNNKLLLVSSSIDSLVVTCVTTNMDDHKVGTETIFNHCFSSCIWCIQFDAKNNGIFYAGTSGFSIKCFDFSTLLNGDHRHETQVISLPKNNGDGKIKSDCTNQFRCNVTDVLNRELNKESSIIGYSPIHSIEILYLDKDDNEGDVDTNLQDNRYLVAANFDHIFLVFLGSTNENTHCLADAPKNMQISFMMYDKRTHLFLVSYKAMRQQYIPKTLNGDTKSLKIRKFNSDFGYNSQLNNLENVENYHVLYKLKISDDKYEFLDHCSLELEFPSSNLPTLVFGFDKAIIFSIWDKSKSIEIPFCAVYEKTKGEIVFYKTIECFERTNSLQLENGIKILDMSFDSPGDTKYYTTFALLTNQSFTTFKLQLEHDNLQVE